MNHLLQIVSKGRPRKMTKKQMITARSTKRDPSGFEYAKTVQEQRSAKKTTLKSLTNKRKVALKDLIDDELIKQVLALFNPKIKELVVSKLKDIAPDGRCGFIICAELLGKSMHDGWKDVRRSMLDELREHKEFYTYQLGGEKNYKALKKRLDYFEDYGCTKKY